jgi:hypothetical protein
LPWAESERAFGPERRRRFVLRPNGPPWLSPGHRPGYGGSPKFSYSRRVRRSVSNASSGLPISWR